jgi:hypothetical protein
MHELLPGGEAEATLLHHRGGRDHVPRGRRGGGGRTRGARRVDDAGVLR